MIDLDNKQASPKSKLKNKLKQKLIKNSKKSFDNIKYFHRISGLLKNFPSNSGKRRGYVKLFCRSK